jgi:hypothetical protein
MTSMVTRTRLNITVYVQYIACVIGFCVVSRLALEPIKSAIQWVPETLSLEVKLHLVPMLVMSGTAFLWAFMEFTGASLPFFHQG